MNMHDDDHQRFMDDMNREERERQMHEDLEESGRAPRNDFERTVQWLWPLLVGIGCLVFYFFFWDGR